MNKILAFFKMYSELSCTSPLSVEDAICALRDNTNLKPDMPAEKSERDRYLFLAHDKIHPSIKDIIPNMHVYGQRFSPLTPVLSIEFSSQGKSDQTTVMIKASPDHNLLSIWKVMDIICILLGLLFLGIAVVSTDFTYLLGFAISLIWILFTKWIGFWIPYKSSIKELMPILKIED